ncbi:MAG: hypothetical protein FJW39_25270 [Acidobacteria bacterium]|nr:hypothetical protein [Acidobacteriota bacterium]
MRNNWFQSTARLRYPENTATVIDRGGNQWGHYPGFVDPATQNYKLAPGSPAINAGTNQEPTISGALLPSMEYMRHSRSQARPVSGLIDLGAWETPQ